MFSEFPERVKYILYKNFSGKEVESYLYTDIGPLYIS